MKQTSKPGSSRWGAPRKPFMRTSTREDPAGMNHLHVQPGCSALVQTQHRPQRLLFPKTPARLAVAVHSGHEACSPTHPFTHSLPWWVRKMSVSVITLTSSRNAAPSAPDPKVWALRSQSHDFYVRRRG